jgi:MFS family permease
VKSTAAVAEQQARADAATTDTGRSHLQLGSMLGSVIVVVMVSSFPVVLTGAMSVEMRRDIGFDNRTLGVAVTVYYIVSALLSSPSGRLTERISTRRALQISAVLAAIACLGISLAQSMTTLVACLVIGGVAIALAQPASNAVIMERVPHNRRGLAFGIKQSSIPAGTALAGLAVPVIALTVGWRWAFVAAAVAALTAAATSPTTPARVRPKGPRGTDPLRGSYGVLIALTVAAALGAVPAMSLPVFLTASATEREFSTAAAGILLSLGSVGGLIVRLIVGARADRRSGGHLKPIAFLMALGALGLFTMTSSNAILFGCATMFAFGAGWAWQGLFNHAVANRWSSSPAAATGLTQTGVFAGGIFGPPAFGWVTSNRSDQAGWLLLGAALASAMILVLIVQRVSTPTDHLRQITATDTPT